MSKPNLSYIDQLSRGEESVKKTLIDVIKTEFPQEKKDYFESVKENNFEKIEENVHRLKHKFSILGLEKSYKLANDFEHNLREKSIKGQQEFEKVLIIITNYLETI
ncbi:Hpt domain-containing protein [uncultured Polaribacter sp.]|uniref:Hpt domain-containing protein n=1 Tax=uncultured Polaribacter sp. TaxID=174711 RepID=UPI00261ADA78|nr:Hpt domain-containing protein [uncultured Polaribacter sp.]